MAKKLDSNLEESKIEPQSCYYDHFRTNRSWTGCPTKLKDPSLFNNLSMTVRRIAGYILFPKILVQYEMQMALSSI